jgi:hypothetical protein
MTDIKTIMREDEKIRNEEQEYLKSPVKAIVKTMFSEKLSGSKYKEFTATQIAEYFEITAQPIIAAFTIRSKKAFSSTPYYPQYMNLKRKLSSAKNVESQLMIMNEYLFG